MEKTTSAFQLCMKLRGTVPFYGFSSSMIELLFLTYLYSDEYVINQDNFKAVSDFRTMISKNSFAPQLINAAFSSIEKKYGIDSGILSAITHNLEDLLTGANNKMIFEFIKEITLPKTSEDMAELIENILDSDDGKDISNTACFSMNSSLIKLTSAILDVKPSETYMDMFCGFSKSSLKINAAEYFGNEINPAISAVANMIMILMGREHFEMKCQDYYLNHGLVKADKILVDGPMGVKLNEEQLSSLSSSDRRSESYALSCAAEALKDGGRAVVLVPTGVLTRTESFVCQTRERLTIGMLKAVIALPPMWASSGVNTSLIVLEKNNENKDVMMIRACSKDNFIDNGKTINTLTPMAINKIFEALGGKEIDGFSKKVNRAEILNCTSKLSWVPERYFDKKEVTYRSVSEVNQELKEEYKRLISVLRSFE